MYCQIINEKINAPKALPNSFKNVLNKFNELDELTLNSYGFYRYETPIYDKETQSLTTYYKDGNIITQSIINIDFRSINESEGNMLLSNTDWTQTIDVVKMGRISENVQDEMKMFRNDVYNFKNSDKKVDWNSLRNYLKSILKN